MSNHWLINPNRSFAMCVFNIGKCLYNIGMRRTRHLTQYSKRECFNFQIFCTRA